MALSDLAIFDEYAREAYVEVDQQNSQLFNEASRGAIVLSSMGNEGSFANKSFIGETAGLIRVRNPNAVGAVATVALTQKNAVSVKVARGTPPVSINHSDWTWIQASPADAGAAYGQQMAIASLAEKLNTAIGVGYAALANEGTNVYDAVPTTDKKASLNNLVMGASKMGDKASSIVAWVMHSKSMHDIYAAAVANGSQLFQIGNVNVTQDGFGRILIMTDSSNLVVAGAPNVYHILGLTEGGLTVEDNGDMWSNVVSTNGTDTIQTTIQSEWTYNVGAKGFKYDIANGGTAPANAALFTGTNWDKVAASNKQLAGVLVKVN
jgi:hypothetical protein